MSKQSLRKLVVLDPGAKKSAPTMPIVHLLKDRLLLDGLVDAKTSFEIGEKREADAWPLHQRKRLLTSYNREKQEIGYLLIIDLSESSHPLASGLTICHAGIKEDAEIMHDTVVAVAADWGYDITPNFSAKFYDLSNLGALNFGISDIITRNSLEVLPQDMGKFLECVKDSIFYYNCPSLSDAIGPELSSLVRNARSWQVERHLIPSTKEKEEPVLHGVAQLVKPYEGNVLLFVRTVLARSPWSLKIGNIPALQIMPGFLTNETDSGLLPSSRFQNAIASGIAQGLYKLLSLISAPDK